MIFTEKKQIGIIIDNYELSSWKILTLNKILDVPDLNLSIIFLLENPKKILPTFNEKILLDIESKRHYSEQNSIEQKNIQIFLNSHPKIQFKKLINSNTVEENENITYSINSNNLDLVIYLGDQNFSHFDNFTSEIWYFSFSSDYMPSSQLIGSKLFYSNEVYVHSTLNSFSKLGCFKISDIFSPINKSSIGRTSNYHFWTCYLRICEALQTFSLNSQDFHKKHLEISPNIIDKTTSPNFLKIFSSLFKKKFISTTSDSSNNWFLLFSLGKNLSFEFETFQSLVPPLDRFWADPFVFVNDKKFYVFFEEFIFEKQKGHISVLEIDSNGNYSKPQKILEKSYHLSYPHIFTYDSSIFMIPDSVENKTVDLYRCEDFPTKWKFVKTLLSGNYIDSNIFFYNDKYWILSGKKSEFLPYVDSSVLHFADSLDEIFTPHNVDPINSNFNYARNAGQFFHYAEKLIYPSQSFSHGYGSGINLNEVIELSEQEFTLKEFKKFEPTWNDRYTGMHTINYSEGLTIIDVKRTI